MSFCMILVTNLANWHRWHNLHGGGNGSTDLAKCVWCKLFCILWKEVKPNSPAALAGLRAHSDYIIGADALMNEVRALWPSSSTDSKLAVGWFWSVHRARTSSPSLKHMRGRSWSCMCTTQIQTTAARWSSFQTVTGVERAGTNISFTTFTHDVWWCDVWHAHLLRITFREKRRHSAMNAS